MKKQKPNGYLTRGITKENYGSKQEVIDSFGMHEGELSRVGFLANLIENQYATGFTYLPRQHKIIFRGVNGFGVRFILDGIDYDDEVSFMIGLEMILNG